MKLLHLENRQSVRRIALRPLRLIAEHLLEELLALPAYELAVHFVSARRMAQVNRDFLGHEGSTDVITFDYGREYEWPQADGALRGELFICPADAVAQALAFGTRWQEEVVRYFVHGVLHLRGYDDLQPAARRIMKKEENRLTQALLRRFSCRQLGA